ncbi:hypothetical protein PDIG_21180 [Penicillium digitatum PHI26]|uniref:Uncharacterized protein n=2 Tax=Penicillium digitatum TaxID=36651 RepID=K9GT26_PEND2|nr:hypothetical protein PDIP_23460 [Penicillium digitatum Pd1]EKV16246.1 hypothetical protein PDIG_21180 [Penicillium digitatum PHI26]EKV19458.1 hypothetical protein PDIP_23460 [Penicillium digitatum Pd1]
MSRARQESLEKLKNWVLGRNSQITKLAQGQGIGSRLDHSEEFEIDGKKYRRFKWKINKKAANATLKELANKDSHKVWAEADVPVDSDASNASDEG